jgi:hypothetical protein
MSTESSPGPPGGNVGRDQPADAPVMEKSPNPTSIAETLSNVNLPAFVVLCSDCGKLVIDEGGRHAKGRWLCHTCASPDPERQMETLRTLENIIANHWGDPIACGAVLLSVRNSKVYNIEYTSFRRWICDRMPCSRSYVYR